MNYSHDNAADDRAALEKYGTPAHDPVTGEVFDSDAPASGWDKERQAITDLRGADWAGRKLREAQEQILRNLEMHHAEVDALRLKIIAAEERLGKANAPFHRTSLFMENALKAFAETHREEVLKGLRAKSRLLPSGVRIGWKKTGGYLRLKDGEAERGLLLKWARRNCPEAVEKRPVVDVNAVKRAIGSETVPDGMERVPEHEELKIETGLEAKGEK